MRPALLGVMLAAAFPAGAAQIVIVNEDGPDEGLNDSSPRESVGGNEGETLGEQRRIALEFAAELLGSRLQSDVSINVAVNFEDLDCSINQANLASAGATRLVENFTDAPRGQYVLSGCPGQCDRLAAVGRRPGDRGGVHQRPG